MAGRMARRQPVGQPLRPSLGQGPGKELQGCALMAQIASGAGGASRAIVCGHRQLGSTSLMARLRSRRGLLGSRILRRRPDLRPQAHGQQSKQEPKGDTTHRHKILRAALFGSRHCQAPADLLSAARKMIRPKTEPTQRRGSVGQALSGQRPTTPHRWQAASARAQANAAPANPRRWPLRHWHGCHRQTRCAERRARVDRPAACKWLGRACPT